ncbi:MAG: hypothetical protein ACJAVV_000791 [Alphaproteobacteria bacterium]|jgi:hypothetical protein
MKRKIYLVFTLILLNFAFVSAANAELFWTVRDKLSLPDPKQKALGIAAMYVDLQQPNVVISLLEIKQSSLLASYKNIEDLKFSGSKSRPIKLDLSGRNNLVYIHLPEGMYQITRVDVPHFDLPYRVSTDSSDVWRFRITRGAVNYVGTLKVDAFRSKRIVNTILVNQYATRLASLKELVAQSGVALPIVHGAGYHDPFFNFLESIPDE